jgi:hypothetical protein
MGIFYMMIKPNLRTELFCTNMTCSMSLAKPIFKYLSFLLNGNSNLNITLRYLSHVPCSLVICLLPLLFNTILFSHSLQRKLDINEYTSDGVILQTWHFFLFCHIYSPLLCLIHFCFIVQFIILSPVPISSMSNNLNCLLKHIMAITMPIFYMPSDFTVVSDFLITFLTL